MSNDLINREAAIETLWTARERLEKSRVAFLEAELPSAAYDCKTERNRIEEDIALLRDVPAERQWISVTERLPEKTGMYITTTMYGEVYCDFWQGDNFGRCEMVIAWMPLPEPYKGGEQDEIN